MKHTSRGFLITAFKDANGVDCSIQESSMATEALLWLGRNVGVHVEGQCLARMHLTPAMAARLIPLLQHFVETGRLPNPERGQETSNDPT